MTEAITDKSRFTHGEAKGLIASAVLARLVDEGYLPKDRTMKIIDEVGAELVRREDERTTTTEGTRSSQGTQIVLNETRTNLKGIILGSRQPSRLAVVGTALRRIING
jgi:hypothetical protein